MSRIASPARVLSEYSTPYTHFRMRPPARPYALGLLLALCLLLTACGEETTARRAASAVPVNIAVVRQANTPFFVNAVGNVQAQATVAIKTQVGGTIVEQRVRDGEKVQEGDLLFRLDPRPFELAIREAQARLDRNRVLLDKATKDLRRYSQLNDINVVAQEQYDKTYADTKSLESDIQLNVATLERAKLDLAYTVITAPISGVVGMVEVTEGNVIKANDDRTLCVINQLEPISISFALPEKYLPDLMKVMRGGTVPVSILPTSSDAADPRDADATLTASLSAMDNAVDTTTGTIRLRAQYANDDRSLWPGQFVRVGLVLRERTNAILVPTVAVLDGIEGSYVYVITPDNVAEARPIRVDFLSGDTTVVASGLTAGEQVVLDGHVRLAPGTRVDIRHIAPAPQEPGQPRSVAPAAIQAADVTPAPETHGSGNNVVTGKSNGATAAGER